MNTFIPGSYREYDNRSSNDKNDGAQAFVRYGGDRDGATSQAPTLQAITDPIPRDAVYVSPIYLLDDGEHQRLQEIDNPYAVRGSPCIATALQDAAEADDRVRYPIHVESDGGESWQEQIAWIRTFITEHLPVDPDDCTPFFSGRRSIHAHVPLFTTEDGLTRLRAAARAFEGDLDPSIYSRKRQFRLPGVPHATTGYPKIPIEWDWSDTEIGQAAVTAEPDPPATVADVLRATIGADWRALPTWEPADATDAEPHLWEPGQPEPSGGAIEKWEAYNRHPYSPYAKAEGGRRSIAIVRPIDGAYQFEGRTHLPCRIHVAMGCNGALWHSEGACPVYLSDRDYRKIDRMDVEPGTNLLLIGGRNRQSRIATLDWEAVGEIWCALLDEDDPHSPTTRADTLETIANAGIEPGQSGLCGTTTTERPTGNESLNKTSQAAGAATRAGQLQRQAERQGFNALSHDERLCVANRLLRIDGLQGTLVWHREQLGDDFDREATLTQLRSIANRYDDLPSV